MKTNYKSYTLLIPILLCCFVACKEGAQKKSTNSLEVMNQSDSLLQQAIKFPKKEIPLSEEAQNVAEKWMLYVAMDSEIKRMKNYTLDDVISNAPSILRASDSLLLTLPKKFRSKPIESRIKILHTKASVLNQLSQKKQKNFSKIKEVAEEVPIDFFNLNIQMNEVFIEMPEIENLEQ